MNGCKKLSVPFLNLCGRDSEGETWGRGQFSMVNVEFLSICGGCIGTGRQKHITLRQGLFKWSEYKISRSPSFCIKTEIESLQ